MCERSVHVEVPALVAELRAVRGGSSWPTWHRFERRAHYAWADADNIRTPSAEVVPRLRMVYRIEAALRHRHATEVVHAWFNQTGANGTLWDTGFTLRRHFAPD